jgi:outer membrane protein TolC
VAVGVPADLVRQRPDVRAAERRVAAQSARVGIAEADLYPALFINGSLVLESRKLSNLFSGESITANIGPSFSWDILNYGRIINAVRSEDARFQELVLTYQNTVLRAGREVEDSLIAFLKSQEEALYLAQSVRATERAVQLANIQYREGTIDFNQVFTLESTLTQQQQQEAQARGDIALNLIGVYRALGGGWQVRLRDGHGHPPVSLLTPEALTPGALPPGVEMLPPPRPAPGNDR